MAYDKKAYVKKAAGKGGPGLLSGLSNLWDKVSGVTRYNSADDPFSAPSMMRRKQANQSVPTPEQARQFTQFPKNPTPPMGQ